MRFQNHENNLEAEYNQQLNTEFSSRKKKTVSSKAVQHHSFFDIELKKSKLKIKSSIHLLDEMVLL